ncbi:MAG: STAS/SEC14 domain-containing protein [bacterium]|nr:STAS/SEC14 domain-containing protein [bacterium]
MNKQRREIVIGKHTFYLDKSNILRITVVGEPGNETVTAMKTLHEKLDDIAKDKVNFLIDLNRAGKPSPEVRNMEKLIYRHKKVRKIAFCGAHPVAKVLANFTISVTKKKDMQFFDTEEKALSWLKK